MFDDAAPWCVHVDLDPTDVDVVSGLLWSIGVTSVQEIDLEDGRCRLVGGTTGSNSRTVVAALGRLDVVDEAHSVASYPADYDGWLDAWRPFARPVRVGRLLVHPAWEPPSVQAGDLAIGIDAQRAFGQGNHPTTRLILAELLDQELEHATVLDVGSGSGVLSVAAALLGAARVVTVDIEPEAVGATRANADRNGVADRVEASATPVEDLTETFDVVLANILATTLIDLAPAIGSRVERDGVLLLSGLLAEQRDDVLAAYPDFRVRSERLLDDWSTLALISRSETSIPPSQPRRPSGPRP